MEDRQWAGALRRRDPETLDRLVEQYGRLLWTVAAGILQSAGTREDVEECVSDVFFQIWQKPKQFDPRRGTLKSYLCLLCRSRALDRLRQLRRVETFPLEEQGPEEDSPEEILLRQESAQWILREIEMLEEPVRPAMELRFLWGLRPGEIAAALNLPVETVYQALRQGKRRIGRRWREEE